jgi:hypothetical protein
MMLRRLAALAALAVLLSAGCGGSDSYKVARVSGRVTLDGKPLGNAAVMFQPVAAGNAEPGPGSGGFTDDDGRYTLKVVGKDTPGAIIGKHKVLIMPSQKDDSAEDKNRAVSKAIPRKYSNKNTPLEFDVPSGGSTSADFELKSK